MTLLHAILSSYGIQLKEKLTGHIFCRIPLNWGLSDFFPLMINIMGLGEKNRKGKVSFLSHHITRVHTINMTHDCAC